MVHCCYWLVLQLYINIPMFMVLQHKLYKKYNISRYIEGAYKVYIPCIYKVYLRYIHIYFYMQLCVVYIKYM